MFLPTYLPPYLDPAHFIPQRNNLKEMIPDAGSPLERSHPLGDRWTLSLQKKVGLSNQMSGWGMRSMKLFLELPARPGTTSLRRENSAPLSFIIKGLKLVSSA